MELQDLHNQLCKYHGATSPLRTAEGLRVALHRFLAPRVITTFVVLFLAVLGAFVIFD